MFSISLKRMLSLIIVIIPIVIQGTEVKNSVHSAKITYEISGGGILTPDNNLTISGTEKYYMKSKENIVFHTLRLTESIEGTINDLSVVEYMHKHENIVMYNVDLNQQVIVKYMNNIPDNVVDLTNLEHNGTEFVANYTCDVWKNNDKKVCIYKGIPLYIQKQYLGFNYSKRARFALFDLNISDELFLLPDFPIEENALLKNEIKTTHLYDSSYFYEKILNGMDNNVSKKSLYLFTEDMVKRQKKNLPMMLQYMKKARECLSIATNQESANSCMSDLTKLTKSLTKSVDLVVGMWTKETQNRIMDYLEENILKLQSHMSCIKRVQNIDDLSRCMVK